LFVIYRAQSIWPQLRHPLQQKNSTVLWTIHGSRRAPGSASQDFQVVSQFHSPSQTFWSPPSYSCTLSLSLPSPSWLFVPPRPLADVGTAVVPQRRLVPPHHQPRCYSGGLNGRFPPQIRVPDQSKSFILDRAVEMSQNIRKNWSRYGSKLI
jgi:hypothetical protein